MGGLDIQAYLAANGRAASFAARATDTGEQQSIGEGAYPQDEERRQQLHEVAKKMDAFFANKYVHAQSSDTNVLHIGVSVLACALRYTSLCICCQATGIGLSSTMSI